jgi:trehalose 6-phosphate phosphatase
VLLPPTPAVPKQSAWFLDLDGTLLELAERPAAVEPTPRFQALLRRLAALEHGAVAFVSGRSMAELDRLLRPYRFAVAAVHGVLRRTRGGSLVANDVDTAALAEVRESLETFRARHEGLLLEDKEVGLALHYRQRPDLAPAVARFAAELAIALPPAFELLNGREVVEIKSAGTDKGSAIRAFMTEAPFAGRTPIFVGDDVTDEAGFHAVNALGGVSIKVSDGESAAGWRLRDVEAVLSWLETALADERGAA